MADRRFALLAARLVRAGVAPRHVHRMVLELSAHCDDLAATAEARGASPPAAREEAHLRIGTDDALAAGILAQPALRSWGYRWPAVVLGLAPLLLYAISFVLICVLLVGTADLLFHDSLAAGGNRSDVHGVIAAVATASRCFMLFGLPSLWCCAVARYASDRLLPWHWPVLGIAATALLSAAINIDYALPTPAAPGIVTAGIGFSTDWNRLALLGGRALLTLALAAGMYAALLRVRPAMASD